MRLLLLFLLFAGFSFGQRGIIRYSKENGLVSNEVNDLTYDNQGFIWLATNNGIDRFDGQRFIHFKHSANDPRSIAGNQIVRIVFDGKQTIYATALNKGMIAINIKSLLVKNSVHVDNFNSISSNKISSFERDLNGNIWLSPIGKGLDRIDSKTGKVSNFRPTKTFTHLNSADANTFHAILQDKFNKDFLWCLSDIGLFSFNVKTKKWSHFKVDTKTLLEKTALNGLENEMRSIVQDGKGNLYIGTATGAFLYFDQLQREFKVYRDPFLSQLGVPISGLAWRDTRYLYVCAQDNEFLLFDSRTKEFIRFEKDERYDIQPFRLVRFGSQVAICSKHLGLFVHNEAQIFGTRYTFPVVRSAVENNENTSGLFLFEQGSLELRSLSNPLSPGNKIGISTEAIQIIPYGTKDFLIKSSADLIVLRKSGITEKLTKLPTGAEDVLMYSADNLVWLYHPKKGLYCFDVVKKKWKKLNLFKQNAIWQERGNFNDIIAVGNTIYLAGSEGVFRINALTEEVSRPNYMNVFNSDEITTLHLDKTGNLWLGTLSSGLFGVSLKENKISYWFDENTEFPISKIEEIKSDNFNRLWIRTSNCVIRADYKKASFNVLNEGNGLSNVHSIICSGNLIYFVQSSSIVAGVLSGKIPESSQPEPYIQRVVVLNNDISKLNLKLFSSDQNSVQFEFGALDFGSSSNNKVYYRLVGLDDVWRNANNKDEVSYYNLPGGNYRFEFKVTANGKSYTAFYDFKVLNPFYLRWWFITLSAFIIVFSIWFYIRMRIRRIETTERMKAQFSADLNEMESKALQAQMNPHFLFNSLNSIRLFVLKNEVDSAANYIAKFSKLLRMILNYSRQDMITVYDEIQSMKLYMDFERLRFDNGFDFDIEIDGQSVLDCQIPPLIVQPFIENAIWHGLMARMDSKGYIHVAFKLDEKALRVRVQDNGIGRDKAKETSSRRSLKEGSVGLQITKERLKGLSFRTGKQNEVEIIDLFDENNQPTGTLVNLYFEL